MIESGVYDVQPDLAAPPGTTMLPTMRIALMKKRITLPRFSRGKAMSTAPIWSGMAKLPKAAKPIGTMPKKTMIVPCIAPSVL